MSQDKKMFITEYLLATFEHEGGSPADWLVETRHEAYERGTNPVKYVIQDRKAGMNK